VTATKKIGRFPRFSLRTLVLFVCLAGAGYGLWFRWEAWVYASKSSQRIDSSSFGFYVGPNEKSPDGTRIFISADEKPFKSCILDAIGNKVIFQFDRFFWGEFVDDNTLRLFPVPFQAIYPPYGHYEFEVWQRRRPEYWWGIAWLPEFWLALMFGLGLVWSVWKDWKDWKGLRGK